MEWWWNDDMLKWKQTIKYKTSTSNNYIVEILIIRVFICIVWSVAMIGSVSGIHQGQRQPTKLQKTIITEHSIIRTIYICAQMLNCYNHITVG